MTVEEALDAARAAGVDRLDAAVLLSHGLGRPRTWLIAQSDHRLAPVDAAAFERAWTQRAAGVPLAYLVGEREFFGLRLAVSAAVLVPRPDTETLVTWALDLLASLWPPPMRPAVADLGTGSGAIALALAAHCPRARLTATDVSEAALTVARGNGHRLGAQVQWLAGDWWQAVGDARFELALSNPPYVAEGDPHLAALVHEPRSALVAGPSGLDDLRRIVAGATARVSGWLLLEHGWDQADAVRAMLREAGAGYIETRTDLAGRPRCTGGSFRRAEP